jgi:hypothetical protein
MQNRDKKYVKPVKIILPRERYRKGLHRKVKSKIMIRMITSLTQFSEIAFPENNPSAYSC